MELILESLKNGFEPLNRIEISAEFRVSESEMCFIQQFRVRQEKVLKSQLIKWSMSSRW